MDRETNPPMPRASISSSGGGPVAFSLLLTLLLASLAMVPAVEGQSVVHLRSGDWVRVQTTGGERTSGRLMTVEGERLCLRAGRDAVEYSFPDLERLEVSVGRRRGLGVLVGTGIGLVGGIAIGAVMSQSDSGGSGANMAVIGVPLLTTPAGALVGALAAPHRFLDVPLRVSGDVPLRRGAASTCS
jgi:hypothetical protein